MEDNASSFRARVKPDSIIQLALNKNVSNSANLNHDFDFKESFSDSCCRICLLELNEFKSFFKLDCDCKGGLSFSHVECAEKWFSIKVTNVCEICEKVVGNLINAKNSPENGKRESIFSEFLLRDLENEHYSNLHGHPHIATLLGNDGEQIDEIDSVDADVDGERRGNGGIVHDFSHFLQFYDSNIRFPSFSNENGNDGHGNSLHHREHGTNNDNDNNNNDGGDGDDDNGDDDNDVAE